MSYQSSPRNVADSRELATFRALTETERRAIRRVVARIGLGQWASSCAAKGNQARLHVTVPGQIVEEEFKAEGLDPAGYGLWCLDPVMEVELIAGGFREIPKLDADGQPVMQVSLRHDQLLMLGLAALMDAPVADAVVVEDTPEASIDPVALDEATDQARNARPDLFSNTDSPQTVSDPMGEALERQREANARWVNGDGPEEAPQWVPEPEAPAALEVEAETASAIPKDIAVLMQPGETLIEARRRLTEILNIELAELVLARGTDKENLGREAEIQRLRNLLARIGEA